MSVRLLLVAIATGALSAWGVRSLTGQQRAPVMVTRLYTGPDGLTHAELVTMKLGLNPVPAGTERSDRINVNRLQIRRWPPGTVNDWHNASQTPGGHHYVMTLCGRGIPPIQRDSAIERYSSGHLEVGGRCRYDRKGRSD